MKVQRIVGSPSWVSLLGYPSIFPLPAMSHLLPILAIGSLIVVSPIVSAAPLYASSLDDLILNQNLQNIESELNDLNRNIQRSKSHTTFSKMSDLRRQLLEKFWSLGLEAFYPSNEGEVRIGAQATCPANTYIIMDMCICNAGYAADYGLPSSSCKDTKQLITVTQGVVNDATDAIESETKESGKGSKEACAVIKKNLDLIDQLRKAADDKLQSLGSTNAYVTAFNTSITMLTDYSTKLRLQYDEQCTQKSTNTASQRSSNTVTLPPDVTSDAWYAPALSAFVNADYISTNQSFRPADLATREEFVRLIVELNGGVQHELPSEPSFDDVPIDSTAFGWFEEAAKEGWLTGQGDCYGTHPCNAKPDDPINRAEAAALIIRSFQLTQGQAPYFVDAPAGAWYGDIIPTAASHCILQGDSGSAHVRPSSNMNRAEMIVMLQRVDQGLIWPNCQLANPPQ